MKKIISILLVGVMMLGMAACGGPTPSDTVTAYLDALKAQDAETVASVYNGDANLLEGESEFTEAVTAKILDFDYAVVNESVEDDKATVEVEITTYDMGSAFDAVADDFVTLAFQAAFSVISEDEANAKMIELLETEITNLEEKTYKANCTLNLTKAEDSWVIDEFDEDSDLYKALLGGMIEAADKFESEMN